MTKENLWNCIDRNKRIMSIFVFVVGVIYTIASAHYNTLSGVIVGFVIVHLSIIMLIMGALKYVVGEIYTMKQRMDKLAENKKLLEMEVEK